MSRKIRKRKMQDAAPHEARFKPKAGPGSVFVEEFVSAKTGGEKRLRNVGEHPLTLAHARAKISDEQFAAGEELRRLYELRGASGRDSTAMNVGGGGALSMPFTQSQVDAIRRLDHFRSRLKTRDWIIVEKFCGEGWSMAEAIRAATACHPSGVLLRLQEALDELVAARHEPRGHPKAQSD
jgi:L-alanine-DL-glutamate epimerase-like enolase superfamily enzyme